MMFRFEKLDVWRLAVELVDKVYIFTKVFPADERFGLTNQMRRAAVSISSNIAEGSGRISDKDFARFVEISYGSLKWYLKQRSRITNISSRRTYTKLFIAIPKNSRAC
jgi:four helix bundle protein